MELRKTKTKKENSKIAYIAVDDCGDNVGEYRTMEEALKEAGEDGKIYKVTEVFDVKRGNYVAIKTSFNFDD